MKSGAFKRGRSAISQWLFVAILAVACAALAALQYRWTGQITRAERDRLRAQLDDRVFRMREDIDRAISDSLNAVAPGSGPQRFPARRFMRVPPCLFRRSGMLVRREGELKWLEHDAPEASLSNAAWPSAWGDAHEMFAGPPRGGIRYQRGLLIRDLPRFDEGEPERAADAVAIAEVDPDCLIRGVVRPIAALYFGAADHQDYDLRIIDRATGTPIYASSEAAVFTETNADASVGLLDEATRQPFGHGGPRPAGHGPPGLNPRRHAPPDLSGEPRGRFRGPPPGAQASPWLLLVRHKAGSLDALVESTRTRNLAVSGAMLLLILAAGAALVHYTRESQRVAELRMNIVAGVSHELRSPLAVIHTAAFNLQREGFANRPDQVRRYGELIATESSRLERLVENALRFSAVNAGHEPRERAEVDVAAIVESELEFFRDAIAASNIRVARAIAQDGARVVADGPAIRHAIRNLIENAMKYGGAAGWLGVAVKRAPGALEIRIADHGPGIAPNERERIFDPFFRGERAIQDQVHGAGLGLSLASEIVKAHGGSLSVNGEFEGGTEFVIRLPADPASEDRFPLDNAGRERASGESA